MYTFDASAEKICLLQIVLQIYTVTTSLITRHPLLMTKEAFALQHVETHRVTSRALYRVAASAT